MNSADPTVIISCPGFISGHRYMLNIGTCPTKGETFQGQMLQTNSNQLVVVQA